MIIDEKYDFHACTCTSIKMGVGGAGISMLQNLYRK